MAHTKAKGSTNLGRDSVAKRLGVKKFGGEKVKTGEIIIRQRGTKYYPGKNVKVGKDHTIYAMIDGSVNFKQMKIKKFNNHLVDQQVVSVLAQNKK